MRGYTTVVFISIAVVILNEIHMSTALTRACDNATVFHNNKCFASKIPVTMSNISVILLYSPGDSPTSNHTTLKEFILTKTDSLLAGLGCEGCALITATVIPLGGTDVEIQFSIDKVQVEFGGLRIHSIVTNWVNGGRYTLPTRFVGPGGNARIKGQSVQEKATCEPGFEGIENENLCAECYLGYYLYADLGTCLQCARGTYQDEPGQERCKQCSEGYTSYYQGSILPSDCVESCSPGSYFNSQEEICKHCGYGKYQNKKDQTSCRRCPSRKTTAITNATSASQCFAACNSGRYLSEDGHCIKCPIGSYRDASRHRDCQACPANLTTENTGATKQDLCNTVVCGAGRFREGSNPGTCSKCARHTYKTSAMTACTSCGDATRWRTDISGATQLEDCKFYCPAGFHIALMGGLQYCKGCPLDAYKAAGEYYDTKCTSCPGNRPRTREGNSTAFTDCRFAACGQGQVVNTRNSLECSSCEYDFYQPVERPIVETCIRCPESTATTIKGAKTEADCKRFCPGGQQLLTNGTCLKCAIGYYKSNEGSVGAKFSTCQLCPNQLITEEMGADSADKCDIVNCTTGEYRDVNKNECKPCPVGSFQDQIQQITCKTCGDHNPGSSTTIKGAKSVVDCNIYPEREWLRFSVKFDLAWSNDYLDNSTSLYQQMSTSVLKQVQPAVEKVPTYSDKVQLLAFSLGSVVAHFQALFLEYTEEVESDLMETLITEIIITNPGPLPTVNITDSVQVGHKNEDNDFPCETGEFFNYQSGECEGCTVGSYQPDGAMEVCVGCPGGYSTALPGQVGDRASLCELVCPAGQERGRTDVCVNCPRGNYKTSSGISSCLPCPDGRINERQGSDNASECIRSCGRGYYGTFAACAECGKGFYQPAAGRSSCLQCPRNTNTASPGADSPGKCLDVCTLGLDLCQNSATCQYDEISGDVACLCSTQYEGKYCEFEIPDSGRSTVAIIAALSVLFGLMAIGILIFCLFWCNRKTKKNREAGYFHEPPRGHHRAGSTHISHTHRKSSFSSVQEQHVIHVIQEPQPMVIQDPATGFTQFVHEPLAHQDVFFQAPQTANWGNHEGGKMFVDPSAVSWNTVTPGVHQQRHHPRHHGDGNHGRQGKKLRRYQYEADQTAFDAEEKRRRGNRHKKNKKNKSRRQQEQDKFESVRSTASSHFYEEIDDFQRQNNAKTDTTTFSNPASSDVRKPPKLTDLETGQDLEVFSY